MNTSVNQVTWDSGKQEGGAPRQAVESLCLSASSCSFWMPLRAHDLEEAKGSVAGEAQDAGPMCASACREAELPGLVAGGMGASSAHLVLQKVSEEPGCSQNPYSPWPCLGREA